MRHGLPRWLREWVAMGPSRGVPVLAVLCVGCALSFLGFWGVERWEEKRLGDEFERRAYNCIAALQSTLATNLQVIRSVESFYAASREVERHEFRAFAGSALSYRRAIAALLWAPRVAASERAAHEAEGRTEGVAGYGLTEADEQGHIVPAQTRSEYFPIFYREPPDVGAYPLGFDLASDARSAELMARARDTEMPVAARPFPLRGHGGVSPGVRVFLPIYRNGVPHETLDERKANLQGFVVAIYRIAGLLDDALRGLAPEAIRVEVFDEAAPSSGRCLLSYPAEPADVGYGGTPALSFRLTASIELADERWTAVCSPTRDFAATAATWLPWAALGTGVLVTLLLAGYLLVLVERTAQIERVVAQRTEDLSRANAGLAAEVERRRAAEANLARSNAELEQFAYVASHDLQEPLRAVSSFVQLLADRYKGKLDSDADEFIGYTVAGALRMQTLIRDLLAYSRVERRGKAPEPTSCEDLLDGILLDLRSVVQESGGQVTHDALPTVVADKTQLGQVFQNLIVNALKFRGDEPPRVHVSALRQGSEWVFSVRDNGIGIDPRHHERIFMMFQRLHSQDRFAGTGIGLAICKKIVERHGGRIWVESAPGEGSTFHFTLPAEGKEEAG